MAEYAGITWLFVMAFMLMVTRNFRRPEISSGGKLRLLIEDALAVSGPTLITMVCLAISVFLGWVIFRAREPVFDVKSLSEWMQGFDHVGTICRPIKLFRE